MISKKTCIIKCKHCGNKQTTAMGNYAHDIKQRGATLSRCRECGRRDMELFDIIGDDK